MEDEVRNEILFNIQSFFEEEADEFQLFNQVTDEEDYYQLLAYGERLQFNKETGELL